MASFKQGRNIWMVLILLHAFWFVGGLCWQHFYNGDSYEYIYLAENMKNGFYYGANKLLPLVDYRLTSRPPLYSLLLLVSYQLFGPGNLPVFLLQNILSVISCKLILDVFRRLYPAPGYSWIYLLFIACYPAQLFFATTLTPDTILQFFLVLYAREWLLGADRPQAAGMASMALWLVLATLTKPIVYPFLLLHLLYACWCAFRERAVSLAAIGLLPLLALTCYGFWNKSRTGLYHISSVQSHNLLNFNARAFLIYKHGQAYSDSVLARANQELDARQGLKAKYEFADRYAKKIIGAEPAAYAMFHLRESARFFIEPGKIEFDQFVGQYGYYFRPEAPNFYRSLREHGLRGAWRYLEAYPYLPVVLLVVCFNLLRLLGWLLFLCSRRYGRRLKFLSGVYILYFAAVTGPVANTRYFMPVLLVLSAISMLGFADFIGRRKAARKKRRSYAG